MPTVTRVRKERSDDGSHEHIEGACTTDGVHHTRRRVADGIDACETWWSQAAATSRGSRTSRTARERRAGRPRTSRLRPITRPQTTSKSSRRARHCPDKPPSGWLSDLWMIGQS